MRPARAANYRRTNSDWAIDTDERTTVGKTLYIHISLRCKPASVHPAPTGLRAGVGVPTHIDCGACFVYFGFEESTMAPMNGTIKRLVTDKGFGFILASDGNEYFFHNSACADTRFDDLREGQAVTFERGQGPKGPRGENVRVA
jgi:CspA family cold shock protein